MLGSIRNLSRGTSEEAWPMVSLKALTLLQGLMAS